MNLNVPSVIAELHAAPAHWVLAVSGGGASAAAELLRVPGGSRSLLEVVVPYHENALAEFLGFHPEHACTVATSQALARRALDRARWLSPGGSNVFGLGCTASLVSDRPKRGDHRIHVSTAGQERLHTWSLTLTKGARDRSGEESVAGVLILHAMAQTLGLAQIVQVPLLPGEFMEEGVQSTLPWAAVLAERGAAFVAEDGRFSPEIAWTPESPMVLMPGAFNPLHAGHTALAELGARLEQKRLAIELSLVNVDKPELTCDEVRCRLAQFLGRAPVWLTRAPRFVDKARLFPGAVFLVGADTAQRLVDPRYYEHDEQRLREALDAIRNHGCRFLVAGRADTSGHYLGVCDLAIPPAYPDMFRAIPEDIFRRDISSTALRAR